MADNKTKDGTSSPLLNLYLCVMLGLMLVTVARRHRTQVLVTTARLCQATAGALGSAGLRAEAALSSGVTV